MNRSPVALAVLLAALIPCSACGDGHDHPHPPASGGTGTNAAHTHGPAITVGTAEVAGFTFTVKREEKVVPGEDVDLDLEFAAGAKRPATARAWIGTEDGVGSRKAKLAPEGDRVLHEHVEVPKPLSEGARLWIEVEDGAAKGKTSFPLTP